MNATTPLVTTATCEESKKSCLKEFLCQLVPNSTDASSVGIRSVYSCGQSVEGCGGGACTTCLDGGCIGPIVTSGCSTVEIGGGQVGKCCIMKEGL